MKGKVCDAKRKVDEKGEKISNAFIYLTKRKD